VAELAIAGALCFMKQPRAVIWIALAFAAPLRPKEAFKLRPDQLVRPSPAAGPQRVHWGVLISAFGGGAGKTGERGGPVLADLDHWLLEAREALNGATAGQPSARGFEPAGLRKLFSRRAGPLDLRSLRPHMHSMGRGGASGDLAAKRRAMAEVERRGQRRGQRSLRGWRLLMEMAKAPRAVYSFGQL
ncbi:unnamed protein product, partial [Prorocentrum cordatum]